MSKRDHYYRNVSTFNIIYLSNSKFQLKKKYIVEIKIIREIVDDKSERKV